MSGVVAQSDLAASAKGMLTYDRTFELYSNWACEARERTLWYDSRGRCVQTYTRYPAGVNCRTSVKYDYAGNPLTTVEQYTYGSSALTITTERTFDSRGRKLTELTTVNGNTVAHAAFAYDEMGRMTETSLNGNIEITADYNLQGWLTRLQASKKSDGFFINDVIFDETLRYHDTNDSLAVPLYAGKIAQLDWKRRMLMSGNDRFLYRYDPQGRLIKAEHRITGIGNSTAGNYCEETEYDLNSNITSFNAVKEDENIQRVYTLNGNRIVGAEYDSRGNITRIPGKNLQIAYNLINLPRSVTAADGTKIDYSYLSDGTKFRAVSETGVNYLYTGSLRWRLQGGTITPESFAIAGGRATLEANGWTAHYYITDHLGSTRAVTDTLGNVLATFDYTPYGELLASSDSTTDGTDYLFTGKENQAKQGAGELYDSKARFMDTGGRFLSIDPLAEEYYHRSPYTYCAGDPVNLVDPEGRLFGDFVDNKGRIIGNDGKDDGKVYVLKISKNEVFENSINGSEYSLDELQEAKKFVKDYSGNTDVFAMRPDIYNYFVEIVGNVESRQEMANIVMHDNGVRNYKEDNRREYGGYVVGNKVTMATPGKIDAGTINLYNTSSTFHSHPSGIEPNTNKIFVQHPSYADIKNNKGHTSYVFGRYDEVVYIYNDKGILSTIPHKFFVRFKK